MQVFEKVPLGCLGRLEAAGALPGIDTVHRLATALETTEHDLLPLPAPPETLAAAKDRGTASFETVLQKGDRELVDAVAIAVGHIADGLTRRRYLNVLRG